MTLDTPLNSARDALHADQPVRVWSVIVTIFGDVVMREGTAVEPEPLATASLQALLELLRIDANAMRASLSRLTADGMLVRSREGRNTFYALSADAARDFREAAQRIYRSASARPSGLQLAVIDRVRDRAAARKTMQRAGWRFIGPTSALGVTPSTGSSRLPEGTLVGTAEPITAFAGAAHDAFDLGTLNEGYRRFADLFASAGAKAMVSAEAAALRILLVHQYRRLALRDPALPSTILTEDWQGERALQVFNSTRARLAPLARKWFEANGFGG